MLRVVVLIYVLFHFAFDWWSDGSVKWDIMYHVFHYVFITTLCFYSMRGTNSNDILMLCIGLLFAYYAIIEFSYWNYSRISYDTANGIAYSYRDFGVLLSLIVIILSITKWLKRKKYTT